MNVKTIGIDLAKNVFQIHGVDEHGKRLFNFVSNRQENYRLNLPNFTDIYARGQQDRKSGMSESDARRTADAIRQQVAEGTKTQHAFTGNVSDKWDNEMENKDAVLFGNELAGTYLDGYFGVK